MAGSRNQRLESDYSERALSFEHVSFGYGRGDIVRNLTLHIQPGELVGLLGPNGSGKSTVLKLGAGVLRPRTGVISLSGAYLPTLSRSEVARRLAVVPQEFTVQFAYTVRQIIELGRMPRVRAFGFLTAADHAAVDLAIETTEIRHLADRVFTELSGGERQRVLVALALAQDTPIVLLDEPTAHLDIRYQVETLDLIRRLNREHGITVLAALHDLNLAARYFPRLILFDGTVVADGAPSEVLDAALLSRVYGARVRVGHLAGEGHMTVMPETTA